MMAEFLLEKADNIKPWASCWYGVNYSMGIGSRFLIGTILTFITGGKVTAGKAYFFCEVCLILIMAVATLMMNNLIKKGTDEKEKYGIIFLILCFISSPGSLAAMWTEGNMGRMETYTLLVILFGVLVFRWFSKAIWKYGILLFLSIICAAIYQGYLFLYYPVFCTVMLCDLMEEEKLSKEKLFWTILNLMGAITSFLFFQFGTSVHFSNAAEMTAQIQSITDLNVKEAALHYEFFSPLSEAFRELNIPFLTGKEHPIAKTGLLCVLLLPIIGIIGTVFVKCLKKGQRITKPYFYCLIVNLAVLPQFVLNVDWGRWMAAVEMVLFFEIFYMYYVGFVEIKQTIGELGCFVQRYMPICIFCVLYLNLFNKFEDRIYFVQLERLWDKIAAFFVSM